MKKPTTDTSLRDMLELIRSGEDLYRLRREPKKNGGWRILHVPRTDLRKLQREINRHALVDLPVAPNVFGFSSGSAVDAIRPHLRAGSILCLDIRDAFPSITEKNVFEALTYGRETESRLVYSPEWDDMTWRTTITKQGLMSWYAAKIITEIAIYHDPYSAKSGILPQGAPTSPRLFDFVMRPVDERLNRLARSVGGKYTRFADNIYFSFPEEVFPGAVVRAILRIIEGREDASCNIFGLRLICHKPKCHQFNGEAFRMLGLNVIDGQIHNTRRYKRKLRLSIHHLNWLLDNGPEITEELEHSLNRFRGQMAYAVHDTLPALLLADYQTLLSRLDSLCLI